MRLAKTHSRRRLLPCMAVTLVILAAAPSCSSRPSEPKVVANWQHARVGMSRDEIRSLFGDPNGTHGPAKVVQEDSSDVSFAGMAAFAIGSAIFGGPDEDWEYAPPDYVGSTLTEEQQRQELLRIQQLPEEEQQKIGAEMMKAVFSGPNDEAFIIYFDANGRVKDLRPPLNGQYSLVKATTTGN